MDTFIHDLETDSLPGEPLPTIRDGLLGLADVMELILLESEGAEAPPPADVLRLEISLADGLGASLRHAHDVRIVDGKFHAAVEFDADLVPAGMQDEDEVGREEGCGEEPAVALHDLERDQAVAVVADDNWARRHMTGRSVGHEIRSFRHGSGDDRRSEGSDPLRTPPPYTDETERSCAIHTLMRLGYGYDDIAVKLGLDPAVVREEADLLAAEGRLDALYQPSRATPTSSLLSASLTVRRLSI